MEKNHLGNEKSLHLLEHVDSPIHWYPWGQEAFDKAKTTNRLIFLSIGYSTSHWCRAENHKSIEKKEVIEVLNNRYVNIKVDREERPDVDRVYAAYVQKISCARGWPLNVFLTPDLKAITGGIFVSSHDEDTQHGFVRLLNIIADQWLYDEKSTANIAESFFSSLKRSVEPKRDVFLFRSFEEIEWKCYNDLKKTYNKPYEEFGRPPKFVRYAYLDFLLCFHYIYLNSEASETALKIVGEKLMAIDRGAIHDHIGKGFHHSSVNLDWHERHFQKMLYDQAQLLALYAVYHAITGEFTDVIEEIVDYISSNLTHPCGGFYNAEDADSLPDFSSVKKREGAYYTWTEKEIDEILSNKPINGIEKLNYAKVFKMYYNIKRGGNVVKDDDPYGDLKSQNILTMEDSHNFYAEKCGLSEDELQDVINEAKISLREIQKKRPKPDVDNKIITSWNGLMISGLAKAAIALQNEDLLQRAKRAFRFIEKHCMKDDCLLHLLYVGTDGEIIKSENCIQAYADDYAFLIQGLLDLYEACFDEQLIKLASDLQKQMDDLFWDTEDNFGYHQAVKDPHIVIRIMDDRDEAEPSINSVASMNLLKLYSITNDEIYKERAQKIFESAAKRLKNNPLLLGKMVTALQKYVHHIKQIIVVGSRSNETTKQMLSLVSKHFDCRKFFISLDPEKDLWLQSIDERLKVLATSCNTPTTYMHEGIGCLLPITSVKELSNRLEAIP